jgi:hypothetical protein
MKKIFIIFLFLFSLACQGQVFTNYYSAAASAPFVPTDLDSCKLWLRADAGVTKSNDSVSLWADQSGNSNDCAATLTTRPLWVANQLNGQPVLSFDGSNDNLVGTTITDIETSSISIFVVVKGYAQTGIAAGIFEIGDYSNGYSFHRNMNQQALVVYANSDWFGGIGSLPNSGFDFCTVTNIKDFGVNSELFVNDSSVAVTTTAALIGAFTNATYHIGSFNGFSWLYGDIAEVILYNRVLTLIEQSQIYGYILIKYGI